MRQPNRQFQGFRSPNATPVPDELFDELLSDLSGAELKVVLYIMRRTFGFKKSSDAISLRQICRGITTREGRILDRGTGLSLSSAQIAIKRLVAKHIITVTRNRSKERGDQASTYSLNLVGRYEVDPVPPTAPATDNRQGGVTDFGTGGSRISVPQETVEQETDDNLRTSKLSHAHGEQGRGERSDALESSHTLTPPISTTASSQVAPGRPGSGGPHVLADVLRAHQPLLRPDPTTTSPSGSVPRPRGRMRPTPQISVAVTEISQEFGDLVHLAANATQAMHLWSASGRSESAFVSLLYEVRSVTRQQRQVRNRMPYFWSVVRDRLDVHLPERDLTPAS